MQNKAKTQMINTQNRSLSLTIADGLSKVQVGDTVIVAWCIGYPHQEVFTAKVERITTKQIVVDGKYFWKGSGKETGTGTHEILPNDESLIEWAALIKKAESAKHRIHEMAPGALKDLLQVFEKHGYIQSEENLDSKQPAPLIEVMEKSGLLDG